MEGIVTVPESVEIEQVAALRGMGVQRGDRVCAILPNRPEALVAFLALPLLAILLQALQDGQGRFVGLDNYVYAFTNATMLESFGNNLAHSVAAYNGGPGYVADLLAEPYIKDQADFYRFIDRDETREYVGRVLYNYAVYRELYGLPAATAERSARQPVR